MDSWETQRESAKATIAEIKNKIALQTQRAEQLRSENKDASVTVRLISVLQESFCQFPRGQLDRGRAPRPRAR
jgi:hypothetical protein